MKLLSAAVILLSSSAFASPHATALRRVGEAALSSVRRINANRLMQDPNVVQECQNLVPTGLSQQCRDTAVAACANDSFVAPYLQFLDTNARACGLTDLSQLNIRPGQVTFEVNPCDTGVREFTPTCARHGGYMCQISVEGTASSTADASFALTAIFSTFDCLPVACTSTDYNIVADVIRGEIDPLLADLPAEIQVDLDFSIFCNNGDGQPANFGSGTQTEVTIGGTVNAAATFTLACPECTPAWSVDVEMQANFDDGQFSTRLAAALNGNEAFNNANCLSVWINQAETYNIYCPDNANLTMAFTASSGASLLAMEDVGAELARRVKLTQDPQPLTRFQGNGLQMTGQQRQFETTVNMAPDQQGGNPAATLSVPTLALAVAAFCAVLGSS